jgi:hypothetical protein
VKSCRHSLRHAEYNYNVVADMISLTCGERCCMTAHRPGMRARVQHGRMTLASRRNAQGCCWFWLQCGLQRFLACGPNLHFWLCNSDCHEMLGTTVVPVHCCMSRIVVWLHVVLVNCLTHLEELHGVAHR